MCAFFPFVCADLQRLFLKRDVIGIEWAIGDFDNRQHGPACGFLSLDFLLVFKVRTATFDRNCTLQQK